jgi:acetate kinase
MHVLVVNCGSSSVKAAIVDPASGRHVEDHVVQRIGDADTSAALEAALVALRVADRPIDAVGHRVVHGGARFVHPTSVDGEVLDALEALVPLAPLHLPANLAGIRAAMALLPDVPHVAVFDTAFHATLPPRAWRYALPTEPCDRYGVRRYGFHGPSHAWVAERAAAWLDTPLADLRVITCHLGNGCSVAAVECGRSVETSMGMTPVEGLVMGTRSGDVDVGALLHLARAEGLDLDGIDALVNRASGLTGLSGVGNDFRDIEGRAAAGDARCRAAINVFTHRLRKYIGAYAAVMGGVDAIVFTGGIGQNSALVRHRAAQRLEFLGARIDEDRNRDARVDPAAPVSEISSDGSRCRLLVVATDEAASIARQAADEVRGAHRPAEALRIPVAVSARHVHLTEQAVEALFGAGHALTRWRDISQPGQYACEEKVTLVGPKGAIAGVRVLGPTRSRCQVEVSRTDEFQLGLDAPIRASGRVDHTPGIVLEGPAGRLVLSEGVIQAQRHIHMTPADAARLGVADRDLVAVAVDTDGRDLVFGDVLVRVKDSYVLEMHIDTDEANAAELSTGAQGVLDATGRGARVVRLG